MVTAFDFDNATFEDYMAAIDRILVAEVGLTHRDFEDRGYRYYYEDEVEPQDVADELLHARQGAAWLTTVGFGGNPAPKGPWRTTDEARESLRRWVRREGADAASLIAAHTIRVHAYTTREAARSADISDSPGRNGCVSIRGLNDFL